MPRRKKEEAASNAESGPVTFVDTHFDGKQFVKKQTEAEKFAAQRRIPVFTKEEGEKFLAYIAKCVKPQTRGNEALLYVYQPVGFVIDLTK